MQLNIFHLNLKTSNIPTRLRIGDFTLDEYHKTGVKLFDTSSVQLTWLTVFGLSCIDRSHYMRRSTEYFK